MHMLKGRLPAALALLPSVGLTATAQARAGHSLHNRSN